MSPRHSKAPAWPVGRGTAAAKDVDGYLARLPKVARAALEDLRRKIRAAAPDAEEVISYQVPTFRLGKGLVAFAAFPDHCSLFLMSTKVSAAHARELRGYDTSGGTIRFAPGKPLPADLVRKLVKARIAENEADARISKAHPR